MLAGFKRSFFPGDYHNMIEITLHAGTNQGVIFAKEDTGNWQITILATQTVFTGNGEYINPVNGNLSFSLYTPANQQTGPGTAEAEAAGNTYPIPFEPKTTTLPIANFTTNGVSVGWLKAHGYTNAFDAAALADPDADGHANWQEYRADTIPTNAQSLLTAALASNTLTCASSTNCTYTFQWSTNLSSNHWNTLTNHPGTGSNLTTHPATNTPAQFFRIQAERINP